ncbi:MAG: biopolymer transporter ExbD [Verrucomicrobia bacterium]|nr:biopolymer transporter ExbD [Verrucomicrobiota bacterium]MCF7707689.1 biopolymer transporter ExbD [Verrucomicrobiota bacterium]
MQFSTRKRRSQPTIILVSLIDVLIVLLIFMMVTTTFKQHPAVKIDLPESRGSKTNVASGKILVTITKDAPHLYLRENPISAEELERELKTLSASDSQLTLAVRADEGAPFGQVIRVMDAAKAANIRSSLNVFVKRTENQGGVEN